jgi:hypothetical protein
MNGRRTGSKGLRLLDNDLSDRDLAIIGQVAELRLMSTRQIEAVHFSIENHRSALSASRTCRRVLAGLTEDRLFVRLDRRVGGIRAGSSGFIYGLGPVGHRVMALDTPRPRFREPTPTFVDHTLAVTQVVVDLTIAARNGKLEILGMQSEPRCWRNWSGLGGRMFLRPDLYVSVGVGELEYRWFVEVDCGSEHLPALMRKCHLYSAYYQSGKEQAQGDVFPRVCWLMPDAQRVRRLSQSIAENRQLDERLFVVCTKELAISELVGGAS